MPEKPLVDPCRLLRGTVDSTGPVSVHKQAAMSVQRGAKGGDAIMMTKGYERRSS